MKLETIFLHGGAAPDPAPLSRAVPLRSTKSHVFRDIRHAANHVGGTFAQFNDIPAPLDQALAATGEIITQ